MHVLFIFKLLTTCYIYNALMLKSLETPALISGELDLNQSFSLGGLTALLHCCVISLVRVTIYLN